MHKNNNMCYGLDKLTKKELQVLKLIAKGMSTSEISEMLKITNSTTNAHLRNMYNKLGHRLVSNTRNNLTRFAIREAGF